MSRSVFEWIRAQIFVFSRSVYTKTNIPFCTCAPCNSILWSTRYVRVSPSSRLTSANRVGDGFFRTRKEVVDTSAPSSRTNAKTPITAILVLREERLASKDLVLLNSIFASGSFLSAMAQHQNAELEGRRSDEEHEGAVLLKYHFTQQKNWLQADCSLLEHHALLYISHLKNCVSLNYRLYKLFFHWSEPTISRVTRKLKTVLYTFLFFILWLISAFFIFQPSRTTISLKIFHWGLFVQHMIISLIY